MNWNTIFEKGAALVFLLLLIGLVGFLTFVPLPQASEKAVLMVIGGLMALSTQALPKMFGSDKEADMQREIDSLKLKLVAIEEAYDKLTKLLVDRHVIAREGIG